MRITWKRTILNVPLNDAGLTEHNSKNPEWNNVFTVELSFSEFDLLESLFNDWNRKFNIHIDYLKNETLIPENAQEAMEILKRHIEKNSDNPDFLNAAEKLKSCLEKAIDVKMPLFLDFKS